MNIVNLISEENLKNVRLFSLDGLETKGRVVSCIDGDSLKIVFPHEGSIFQWNCRLFGIDTPEIRTKNLKEKEIGYKAKEQLEKLVLGRTIFVKCRNFDKFGRILVELFVEETKENIVVRENVVDKLITDGLGRPYSGGKKMPWFSENGSVLL